MYRHSREGGDPVFFIASGCPLTTCGHDSERKSNLEIDSHIFRTDPLGVPLTCKFFDSPVSNAL